MGLAARAWFIAATGALPLQAQFVSLACPNVPLAADDFAVTELFNRKGTNGAAADSSLAEPVHMDVRVVNKADGKYDHSDIIFVQRTGDMKWYDGSAKTVTLMGHIEVHSGPGSQGDNGLMGVALDPAFEANRFIYAWYSPKETVNPDFRPGGQNRQLRLSRFTVKTDNTLDMAGEKILINILGNRTDNWNSGGPMQFDAYGDLWVAVGTNGLDVDPAACSAGNNVLSPTDSLASAEWGAANTHSLRGGFFRIHPDDSPKGYSIPKGNFGEYWADQFEKQGNSALAAEYRDTSKVLPEVYVKGERSNFSPLNSGVKDLPPAVAGTFTNLANVAIGGPIYSFDPSLDYDFKFPPQLDGTWLMGGFNGGLWGVKVEAPEADPRAAGAPARLDGSGIFKNLPIRNFVQGMYGKDGTLYILNYDGVMYGTPYNPGVFRVTYNGNCHPPLAAARPKAAPYQEIRIDPQGIAVREAGPHSVSLYDMHGSRVWQDGGTGPHPYRLADIRTRIGLRAGVYLARVDTPAGGISRRVSLF